MRRDDTVMALEVFYAQIVVLHDNIEKSASDLNSGFDKEITLVDPIICATAINNQILPTI